MMVTCPCCHGAKRLTVVEHDEEEGRTMVTKPECTHCEGKGEIEAEAPRADEPIGPTGTIGQECPGAVGVERDYSTPGLRRGEMTRAEKKEHLLALKTRPDEVEKLLAELYGSPAP